MSREAKYRCHHCFEWSYTKPCDSCGAPITDYTNPTTPEEIAAEVHDRLRGGPKRKMREFASSIELDFEDLMQRLHAYVDGDDDGIHLGVDTPYDEVPEMWDWFELITGKAVPASRRDNPFSCSC
jgi:hypothetical protein